MMVGIPQNHTDPSLIPNLVNIVKIISQKKRGGGEDVIDGGGRV